MSTNKLRAGAMALALLAAGPAAAQSDQLLLDVDFTPRDVAQVEVGDFHFRPGQIAPVHTHAAPAIGYVSKGTIYYQVEGMPAQILKAGDAFYEPVGPRILHFDNASKTEEAVFTDFNLEQAGEPFIVFDHPPTEKIDRRTFPTAPIVAPGVSKALGIARRISPGAPLIETPVAPVVGYVAEGNLRLSVDGAVAQDLSKGQSYFVPAGHRAKFEVAGGTATLIAFSLQK